MTEETAEGTFTAKQLARKLNTDPKTLRKFLRSKDSPVEAVGQGGRYEFDADAAKLIAKSFKDWGGVKPTKLKDDTELESTEEAAPKTKAPRKPRSTKAVEPPVVEDAVEELEPEPSDEDLEEIEDLDDLFDELDED